MISDPTSNPLRDAANVIADAVEKAKDEKIVEAEAKLKEAARLLKEGRKDLIGVLKESERAAAEISQALDEEKEKESKP